MTSLLDAIEGTPRSGLPPVLLVHGFASSFEHNWRYPGWADLLAEESREVIGVDLPGHGTGPRFADPAAYADVEEHVRAALADHDEVDAIGFSMGARIVLALAAREPARFRRIVAMGVGANLFRRDDDPEALARALESGPDPEDVLGRLFRGMARSAGNDDLAALAAFARRPRPPLEADDLARIACPVRVVIGDEDFAGPGDPLVEALPDAELVVVEGVDHFRAPQDFHAMSAALDFVNEV